MFVGLFCNYESYRPREQTIEVSVDNKITKTKFEQENPVLSGRRIV